MRLLLCGLLCLPLALAAGCGSDGGPSDPGGPDPAGLNAVVAAAGQLTPVGDEKDEIINSFNVDEGDFRYTYETHDVIDNVESVAYLGLNDDIIWPGSLIKGDRAHIFVYDPITVSRAPVTLSVNLESSGGGGDLVEVVDDPKLSTIRQGISDLLDGAITAGTTVPARVDFSYQQVYSESQMSMYVNADVSYGLGDLDTAFDWNSTTRKTKIVAKYRQLYYSVDMDTPTSPAAIFGDTVTAEALSAAMPPGSMPLYVSGVTYGMMALMTIETNFSEEEMSVALDAAYSGTVDVELETGYTAREMMNESSIRIVVYGGSTAGLGDIEEGFAGFMKIVEASQTFGPDSPGVPLIYKFRHLADNTLAQISFTSQYTLVKPVRLKQRVRITAQQFFCTVSDDEGVDNWVDMDRFQVRAWAHDKTDDADPGDLIADGVYVYNYSTAGEHTIGPNQPWICGEPNTYEVVFDSENHDFDSASLRLWAYARDYDSTSANEDGSGETTIQGRNFLQNGGVHTFTVTSADFAFTVYVLVELVD